MFPLTPPFFGETFQFFVGDFFAFKIRSIVRHTAHTSAERIKQKEVGVHRASSQILFSSFQFNGRLDATRDELGR